MNKYIVWHRRLSVEWTNLHAKAYENSDPLADEDENVAAFRRMMRVMRITDRVEQRLDNYARQAQIMNRIEDMIFQAVLNRSR